MSPAEFKNYERLLLLQREKHQEMREAFLRLPAVHRRVMEVLRSAMLYTI